MMEGWEKALKVSFIAVPVKAILGKDVVNREEIPCNDAILMQLVNYGFLILKKDDSYQVVITREDFEVIQSKIAGEFLSDIVVDDTNAVEFRAILANNDALTYFSPFIAPKIEKMDACKVAILIALASNWDEADDRFRVHVLMYGKDSSGTGKTPILKWLHHLGGAYIDSIFATRAGITVNLRDGSPGVLAKYHHGVCASDELDKMPKIDRDGILSALEDGTVTYVSGNVEGEYPAEIIGVAGANSITHFTPEQLLRFDFRFKIDQYTKDEACDIADSISAKMGKVTSEESSIKLAKFLKWIRSRKAKIPDDVRAPGAEEIKHYIRLSGNTDIRRIESIWRVARAIARLNYHDVTLRDIKTAIILLDEADKTKKEEKEK